MVSFGLTGGFGSRGEFSIALLSARRVALRSAFSSERDLSFSDLDDSGCGFPLRREPDLTFAVGGAGRANLLDT